MKDNTPSLEVKEDGQIWLNDGRQSILVSNQEVARELLFLKHCISPKEINGIYPIPDLKWEVVAKPVQIGFEKWDQMRVAVISLPESEKPIEPKREDYEFNYLYERALADYSHDLRRYYEKAKRKKLLIEMMQEDEKNGMYEPSKGDLKETQEAMWNYVDFLINDPALPPRSWEQIRKQLAVEFTITRKS